MQHYYENCFDLADTWNCLRNLQGSLKYTLRTLVGKEIIVNEIIKKKQPQFLYTHFKCKLLHPTFFLKDFSTLTPLSKWFPYTEKVSEFFRNAHMTFSIRSLITACHCWWELMFSSAVCVHTPLSTLNKNVDSVLGVRIACTSVNRKHNSLSIYDNVIICFLKVVLSQCLIYSANYLRCVESDFPSVCIIIKQLLKMVLMFWTKILI